MKRTILATSILAMTLSAAAPLFAAESTATTLSPHDACKQQAREQHIAREQRKSFMKSCIRQHRQSPTEQSPAGPPAQP